MEERKISLPDPEEERIISQRERLGTVSLPGGVVEVHYESEDGAKQTMVLGDSDKTAKEHYDNSEVSRGIKINRIQ